MIVAGQFLAGSQDSKLYLVHLPPTIMLIPWTFLSALLLTASATTPARRSYDTHNYYVLHHDPTTHLGASLADVVDALRVELVEQAGELKDYWIVRQSKRDSQFQARGGTDLVLSAFDTLKARAADEDSSLHARSGEATIARRIVSSVDYLSAQTLRQRSKRAPPPISPPAKDTLTAKAVERYGIQDPTFPQQWHLVNNEFPEHMMNVTGIWDMGYTGKGIISSLVDDGLDYESLDLAANFVCQLDT
jgi:kexin